MVHSAPKCKVTDRDPFNGVAGSSPHFTASVHPLQPGTAEHTHGGNQGQTILAGGGLGYLGLRILLNILRALIYWKGLYYLRTYVLRVAFEPVSSFAQPDPHLTPFRRLI